MKKFIVISLSFVLGAAISAFMTYRILNRSGEAAIDYLLITNQVADLKFTIGLLDLSSEDMRCKIYEDASYNASELRKFRINTTRIIGSPGMPIVTKNYVDEVLSLYENKNINNHANCNIGANLD